MKRIIAITATVAVLALAAAACAGGGSVTVPSRVAAVNTEPATVETYCALEAQARSALDPFLKDGANPIAEHAALAKAASLASQVAVVAPDAVAGELSTRSRVVTSLYGAVAADRYDVGRLGPRHPALIVRSPAFVGTLDRINTFDVQACDIAN